MYDDDHPWGNPEEECLDEALGRGQGDPDVYGYPGDDTLQSQDIPLDIGWALLDVNQLYEFNTTTTRTGRDK